MKKKINLLLADDGEDDRFFFADALKQITIPTTLVTVNDGEKLIDYLLQSKDHVPDILFLDINMPRMKGSECLAVIKSDKSIKEFPIVIYSTCVNNSVIDELYKNGAHYCKKKGDLPELIISLQQLLQLMVEKKFIRPTKEHFILNSEVIIQT